MAILSHILEPGKRRMEAGRDAVLQRPFSFARSTVLLIAMLAASVIAKGVEATLLDEYQVKAAFLYNFAKFVKWPADEFPDSFSPITLCILGMDPFGTTLEQTIDGKIVNSRQLVIKRFKEISGYKLDVCQILFVSLSETRHLRLILEALKDSSVLTVSEIKRFAQQGGMIQLILEKSKVRFQINVTAAERAGLKISSRLLKLAKVIWK